MNEQCLVGMITKSGLIIFGQLRDVDEQQLHVYQPIVLSYYEGGSLNITDWSFMKATGIANISINSLNMFTTDLIDDIREFYMNACVYVYEKHFQENTNVASPYKIFADRLKRAISENRTLNQLLDEEYTQKLEEIKEKKRPKPAFDILRILQEEEEKKNNNFKQNEEKPS